VNGKLRFETRNIDMAYSSSQTDVKIEVPWEDLLADRATTQCGLYGHWVNYILGEAFRSSRAELQELGVWFEDAVQLENGGYMGGTGVLPIFHCLVSFVHPSKKYFLQLDLL
jgi:hypothetical protein